LLGDRAQEVSVLIAQALAEYGAMAILVGAIHDARYTVEALIRGTDRTTVASALFGVFIVWFLVGRFRT
jgi:hypothetical protein